MGRVVSPETSAWNNHSTLHITTEASRSYLRIGGRLKTLLELNIFKELWLHEIVMLFVFSALTSGWIQLHTTTTWNHTETLCSAVRVSGKYKRSHTYWISWSKEKSAGNLSVVCVKTVCADEECKSTYVWIKVDQLDDTCFIFYCLTCFRR